VNLLCVISEPGGDNELILILSYMGLVELAPFANYVVYRLGYFILR